MAATDFAPTGRRGHLKSLLFDKLPVEIRLKIYGLVFANNKMLFGRPNKNGRGGVRYFFEEMSEDQTTGPYEILLTCHAAYSEGLAEYWSATTVMAAIAKGPSPYNNLIHRLPEVAKARVKHLRQIADPKDCMGELRPSVCKASHLAADLELHEFLLLFPRLETCEFRMTCISRENMRERVSSFDDHLTQELRRYNYQRDSAAKSHDDATSGQGQRRVQAVVVRKTFLKMNSLVHTNNGEPRRFHKAVGWGFPLPPWLTVTQMVDSLLTCVLRPSSMPSPRTRTTTSHSRKTLSMRTVRLLIELG